ncbi:hypothetical protein TNCV_4207671 [Trichonephila clavipes]|nr:hypothetical protein TNCV_4207671 [Trichonephila clavipes]
MQNDKTEELMDLTLPESTVPRRPNSPVDLTDRATDDSSYLKLQSLPYYIRIYEFFTEQAKNAIKVLFENGFNDPNDPEVKRKYQDVEYYTQRHHKAVTMKYNSSIEIQLYVISSRRLSGTGLRVPRNPDARKTFR